MFERLQKKWNVSGLQFLLILCTFAIGGSLTGWAGRKLINQFDIEQNWIWILIYILVMTLIWPFAVLAVSIFFGQFHFFINYLAKMGRRIGIGGSRMGNIPGELPQIKPASTRPFGIAIFASGAGSNAQKIIDHFRAVDNISIKLIACNRPGAGVVTIGEREGIPTLLIDKEKFFRGDAYVAELKKRDVDLIVLAGFLWKVPVELIRAYPAGIINIHPALLPAYGGKGMYGANVHKAVLAAGEEESGITIHYVDEHYDHGDIIFQARCEVFGSDTPETLAARVHGLEHLHYPAVIEKLVESKPARMVND